MSAQDYFMAGLTKAIARRKKEQAKESVQKIGGHSTESNVDSAPVPLTISVKQFDVEQYRAAIITKMIELIAKRKGITASHGK